MFKIIKQCSQFIKVGNTYLKSKPPGVYHINQKRFCTESSPLKELDIAAITKGDPELEHKLKVLILEIDVMRQEGKLVPNEDYLKDHHYQELLTLQSFSQRRKFLEFLFKISKKKEHTKEKKELKRQQRSETKPEKPINETFEEFVSKYDLAHNNIFLRFYDTTINHMYNNRLIQAMQFGQKLVVDCGYENKMTKRENQNCAKQLTLLFAENRNHDDPYDLHFFNLNPNGTIMQCLSRQIGTLHEPWFPLNIHESSYLDKFPKDQLVYLTPHCREEMSEYDHDAIYIIGGIVDKVNTDPLSLAKAKKEGLRMAKFPLDRYLQWGAGSGKSLTINQVAAILLDVKVTGDWKHALRHVPKRKIVDITEETIRREQLWKTSRIQFKDLHYKNKYKSRVRIRSLMEE